MIERLKNPAVWGLFLLIVFFFLVITYVFILAFAHFFSHDISALGVAIVGGIISGGILVIFDIIFGKGLAQEENENEKRMKIVVQKAVTSDEVRQMIREEIKREGK